MSRLAQKLIADNKLTQNPKLDLGKCSLRELPEELFDCIWLEELYLCNSFWDIEKNTSIKSNNDFGGNELAFISHDITKLQNLRIFKAGGDSFSKWSIVDFSFLESFPGLQSLDLSGNQIEDISFLKPLTGLHHLDLSHNKIKDFSLLRSFTGLRDLDLSGNEMVDISFIRSLNGLRNLDIRFNQINDISFLGSLTCLQHLYLRSNYIEDVSSLESLTDLRYLDLRSNYIKDLRALKSLRGLQHLILRENQIHDGSFLASLTDLQYLDLSYNQVKDVSFLQSLTNLLQLNLNCNKIEDVSHLQTLISLQNLDLETNNIRYLDKSWLVQLNDLSNLNLKDNPIQNIKKEIISQYNCLSSLRSYFKDAAHGILTEHEEKIILIGNGGVGKTTLINRWLDDKFDENGESTHAIILRGQNFPAKAQKYKLESLWLNIWDFGGQDIYHATHRYFMQTNAIFLLVWDALTEQTPGQEQIFDTGKKVRYKNLSVRDWLSYISTQSKTSNVIIAQTKRDLKIGEEAEFSAAEKKEFNIKAILQVESSSDAADNGFEVLESTIFQLVAQQLGKNCAPLPIQWFAVKEKIWALQNDSFIEGEKQKQRQMKLPVFLELCEAQGLEDNSAETLLNYFHNTGLFYYRPDLFGNNIVLDQQWAINAVYRIFNREDFFAEVHPNGKFTALDLNYIWNKPDKEGNVYNTDEQQLFVSFMKQCEICFELTDEREIPYLERTFIAPQLLPAEKPNTIAVRKLFKRESIHFKYKHRFLQAAIIHRFIVRCGYLASEVDLWQNGLIIEWEGELALIEANPAANEIIIETESSPNKNLLEIIRNEIKEIIGDEAGIEELVSLDNAVFVNIGKLKKHPVNNEMFAAEDGSWVNAKDYQRFLHVNSDFVFDRKDSLKDNIEKKQAIMEITKKKPEIFFSYAWGDEREKIVDKLYNSLEIDEAYTLRRDKKELQYKDNIRDFMKKIGKGDFVVVALSRKYMESENCMFELNELYKNSNHDFETMLKKIYPIRVESLSLNTPKFLDEIYTFWESKENEWRELIEKRALDIGIAQHQEYKKIKTIKDNIGDLMNGLHYINTLTTDRLSADNFDEIKAAVCKKANEGK